MAIGALAGQAAGEEFLNASAGFIAEVGRIGNWLQALGIVILLGIIFQVIGILYNRKRVKEVKEMRENLVKIERKLDKILRKYNG